MGAMLAVSPFSFAVFLYVLFSSLFLSDCSFAQMCVCVCVCVCIMPTNLVVDMQQNNTE